MRPAFKPNPNLAKELAAELGTEKRVVVVYIEDDDEPFFEPPSVEPLVEPRPVVNRTSDPHEIAAWFKNHIEEP